MKTYLKIAAVTLCAFIIAMIASRYVQLSSTEALHEYERKYQELSTKPDITETEKRALDILFKKLNSAENIKADLIDFVIKYSTLSLALIPLTIYAAKQLRLEDNPMFAASGLIFLAFILAGLMVPGAVLGSLFFIASVTYRKRRVSNQ